MTITVSLPDGTEVDFPDGTPEPAMKAAMAKHVAKSSATAATKAGESAAKDMSFGEKVAAGAGSGVENILHSIGLEKAATAVRGGGSRDNIAEIEKGLGGAGTLGRIASEVAVTAIPATKVAQVAAKVAPWLLKSTLAARAAKAGIEGAVAGGMTNEDNLKGAAFGGATGAVASPILSKVFGMFGKPVPQSAAAEAIRKEGVPVSAGQGADPTTLSGRIWQNAERTLSRLPLVGAKLHGVREKAHEGFREAAINRILPKEIIAADKGSLADVRAAKDVFTDLYDAALKGKKITMEESFEDFVIKAINDPAKFMTGAQREAIEANVGKSIFQQVRSPAPTAATRAAGEVDDTLRIAGEPQAALARPAPGTAVGTPRTAVGQPRAEVGPAGAPGPQPGPTLKDIVEPQLPPGRPGPYHDAPTLFKGQSELRTLGRKFSKSDFQSQKDVGRTFKDISDEVYKMIGRQEPDAGAVIERLRKPYADFLAVKRAAEKAPGTKGEYTPTMLRKASKDVSDDMGEFARRGEDFLAGKEKPLGTVGKGLTWATLLGAGAVNLPGTLTLAGGTNILGTQVGQRALRGDLAAQKMVIEMLRKDPTFGSKFGGVAGSEFSQRKQ